MNRSFEKALVSFLRDTTRELRKAREEAHRNHPKLFTNMTHQQKLEAVRQACIKANPEIVELKLGCAYRVPKRSEVFVVTSEHVIETIKGMGVKIIGRPPRLADVMLPIGRYEDLIHVTCDGWFCVLGTPVNQFFRRAQWNLRKDSLDEQSEETISFLYELLK